MTLHEAVPLAIAAGAVSALVRSAMPKAGRGRLRQLGWNAGLLAISVSVMSTVYGWPSGGLHFAALLVALAAFAVIAVRPRLAQRIVPVALLALGLFGFVAARDFTAGGPLETYGLFRTGGSPWLDVGSELVLPQAWAFGLLGGYLAWRSPDSVLARARAWLLSRGDEPSAASWLRRLLLLPVAAMAAELLTPGLWIGGGAGIVWSVFLIGGAIAIIRRAPELAGRIAAAGILVLGAAGLMLAWLWDSAWRFPADPAGMQLYGVVPVFDQHLAYAAAAQALCLLTFGAWLLPQAFPLVRRSLGLIPDIELTRRVERLTQSRSIAVDTASADLRRLERDLHDGAQARLVALGMSLRAAERLIPLQPDAAIALVAEAREMSVRALSELRELVRGVLPPVLADRGLADAVRALALDSPLYVTTDVDLPGRLPALVETACYFAVAEVLTNAAKHSGAREARISVGYAAGLLRIEITDFGLGGADPAGGSGLAGVEKRLATFDGILAVSSPAGGPTIVVLEVPCALSSAKISSC